MADKKTVAEKKVVISDLQQAIGEIFDSAEGTEKLRAAITAGIVKAEVDEVEVDSGKYSGDYVRLSVGDAALEGETVDIDGQPVPVNVIKAMLAIAQGNLTSPVGDDDEVVKRAPAVVKWFIYGADLAARSRTSQRIKSAAEGPDKAIESMAKTIVKNKPGVSMEQARMMARTLLED